ncbi:unnamed protein product [Polarella glacialis]|uniref:Methenyltetrahydrofolate synthase domain-containing protein n=1 Tax=Polarella glacialis TaxID=89957 RepID=A0A813GQR0_POLGL|nr:unnamed protein product [Polarella glacialis]
MGEALGCGGQVSDENLKSIEQALQPIYNTLPKIGMDCLDRRSLRYLAYRYFNQRFSIVVRGFEPSRPVNDSSWGSAEVLNQLVPGYVESVLESRHAKENGFDLGDAAYVVATLEQLIFDAETHLLEKVYQEQKKPMPRILSEQGLQQVLEAYMVHWMMGEDAQGTQILLGNQSLLASSFPHWGQLVNFASGQVRSLDFQRQTAPAAARSSGHTGGNALSQRYSFDDAHSIVGGITRSFASFWESECTDMKEVLVAMDPQHTGRVPLSKFYGTGLDSEWRFGESESYLRELGALDESGWTKQVIIPNYIQAASNCIVTTSHYMVCCANDCEPILRDIEEAVGESTAQAQQLISLVGNMTSMTSLEDETAVKISAALVSQLEATAAANGGKVPLHGRLFQQWVHYVFPRQCPFPHKTGTVVSVSPLEFGNYIASAEEMRAHAISADNSSNISATIAIEDMQWMSQWSEEEELFVDYQGLSHKSLFGRSFIKGGFLLFVVAALVGVVGFNRKTSKNEFLPQTQDHRITSIAVQRASPLTDAKAANIRQEKWAIRKRIWDYLEENNIAANPRPVHHRIPNFVGAELTAKQVEKLPEFHRSRWVKVNPDTPQKPVRAACLRAGKMLLVPQPRLRTGFFSLLNPAKIEPSNYMYACTQAGVVDLGEPIDLDAKIKVGMIVIGSVAVNPANGARIGKGEGFAELEYGMLRMMGAVDDDTPVVTCIHDCQLVDDIPSEKMLCHDVPVDIICTPTRIIRVNKAGQMPKPTGIYWDKLSPQKLASIKVLQILKAKLERELGQKLPSGPSEVLPPTAERVGKGGKGPKGKGTGKGGKGYIADKANEAQAQDGRRAEGASGTGSTGRSRWTAKATVASAAEPEATTDRAIPAPRRWRQKEEADR